MIMMEFKNWIMTFRHGGNMDSILRYFGQLAYLFYYHVSDKGMSSKEEYENEMAMAEREVAAFKASQKLTWMKPLL